MWWTLIKLPISGGAAKGLAAVLAPMPRPGGPITMGEYPKGGACMDMCMLESMLPVEGGGALVAVVGYWTLPLVPKGHGPQLGGGLVHKSAVSMVSGKMAGGTADGRRCLLDACWSH